MSDQRKKRLQTVIYAIRELTEFSLSEAKLRCRDISAAYVTKTINQLVRQGLLTSSPSEDENLLKWTKAERTDLDTWIIRQVHGDQVKESPLEERPREQLLSDGAENLTDAQLIAILIRVGVVGESAIQAGRKLSNAFAERIADLPGCSLAELRPVSPAIRKDSYCQIMAGIELGRRVAALKESNALEMVRIRGSVDAVNYCMRVFRRLAIDGKQEEFHIVTLDTQHGPIGKHLITKGTLDASLVHPREVFKPAIRDSAASILLVHNHPSGDPTPSREDHAVTRKLTEVGELIGIRVLDHIVVARESGRSILAGE